MLKLLRRVDETGGTLSLELRSDIRLFVLEFHTVQKGEMPKLVYSRDGKEKGRTTGGIRYCTLEGCKGPCIGVRWPDRKITWPCRQGMAERPDGQLQIGIPLEGHA